MKRVPHRRARPPGVRVAIGLACLLGWATQTSAADPVHGKAVFVAQCSSCHTANRGGGTLLGPNLFGVVGRRAGSVPGFAYSSGMRTAGFAWSSEKLAAYLPAPRSMIADTKMSYLGLHNAASLADVVAFLTSLK